jgi:hypothetical protein
MMWDNAEALPKPAFWGPFCSVLRSAEVSDRTHPTTVTAIAEQWFSRAVDPYPEEARSFIVREKSPFRNPVGHTLRESLTVLARELLGGMDGARMGAALEEILRLRAVQDLSATQAVGFVFALRPILRDAVTDLDAAVLNDRIDQLALMAFDEYRRRREQLAELRAREGLGYVPVRLRPAPARESGGVGMPSTSKAGL